MVSLLWPRNKVTIKSMEKCRLSSVKNRFTWISVFKTSTVQPGLSTNAVFPYIKSFLRGMRFDNLSELRQAVMNVIFHMKTYQFVQIFDDWLRRHKKCVELKSDYVLNFFERLTSLNVKNFYRCARVWVCLFIRLRKIHTCSSFLLTKFCSLIE